MKPRNEANDNEQAPETNENPEESLEIQRERYNNSYSRWDTWVPNDEATLLEAQEEEKKQEDAKNKEFEASNKEFCGQFLDDMHKREESRKKKEEDAEKCRLKGNKFFKAKNFDRANELYMEALKESQYDVKTLTNIAQVCIKSKNYPDALEFLSRTLYLEPDHIKALSRKAFVLAETGKIAEAQATIQRALAVEPNNPDLISEAKEIDITMKELAEDAEAAKASEDGHQLIQNFRSFYNDNLKALVAGTVSLTDNFEAVKKATTMFKEMSANIQASKSANTDLKRVAIQALIRKNLLVDVVEYCKLVIGQTKAIGTSGGVLNSAISSCLVFIALSVEEQRSSKMVVLEAKLISTVKPLLKDLGCLDLIHSVIKFVRCCCKDDICLKSRAAIFSDKPLLLELGTVLGNLSYTQLFEPIKSIADAARRDKAGDTGGVAQVGIGKKSTEKAKVQSLSTEKKTLVVSILHLSAQIIRDSTLVDGLVRAVMSVEASSLVCALASTLYVLQYLTLPEHILLSAGSMEGLSKGKRDGQSMRQQQDQLLEQFDIQYTDEKECLIEALLGLSQVYYPLYLPSPIVFPISPISYTIPYISHLP